MFTDALTTALDACRSGDDAAALVALLDAWRASRDDAIGDAIVALGPRAARRVPAPIGETRGELEEAWLAAAQGGEPCVLHHLIRSAAEGGEVRLLGLGADDPRPARTIASLVARPKLRRSIFELIDRQVKDVWRPLTALLVTARDARALATLASAVPAVANRVPPARRPDAMVRIEAIVAAVRAACEPLPALPVQDRVLLEQIVAHITAPVPTAEADATLEAALLADVYRDPADDGPRIVYADWLNERGNPRGEFIALQLAHNDEAAARASSLLAIHMDEYLGSLAGHVGPQARFERGFVTRCTVKRAPLPEDAAWATISEIEGGLPVTDACPMPVLANAYALAAADLARLASLAEPPPLVAIEVRGAVPELPSITTSYVAIAPRLAHLKTLALHGFGGTEPFEFALHARPLETLEITAPLTSAAAWFEALQRSAIRSLVLHAHAPRRMGSWIWLDSWLRITRDDVGWRIELQAVSGTKAADIANLIDHVIAPLVARMPRIALFALAIPASSEWRVATRNRIAEVLDAHPALVARDLHANLRYEPRAK